MLNWIIHCIKLTMVCKRSLQSFDYFCPSVHPSISPSEPSCAKIKGCLKGNTHLRYTRHKGVVVALNPAQWCIYM